MYAYIHMYQRTVEHICTSDIYMDTCMFKKRDRSWMYLLARKDAEPEIVMRGTVRLLKINLNRLSLRVGFGYRVIVSRSRVRNSNRESLKNVRKRFSRLSSQHNFPLSVTESVFWPEIEKSRSTRVFDVKSREQKEKKEKRKKARNTFLFDEREQTSNIVSFF